MKAAQKIVRQQIRMALGGECFFGSLALRFPWVEDNTCPTMATDGQKFYLNSQFVESITENEVKAVIIHEIMHVALMHPLRVKGHDHRRANIAMDYAINLLIRDAGYGLPSMALLDDRYKDMSWEQIYKLLPEQKKDKSKDGQGQGQGQPDFSNGDVLPCPGTAEELSAAQEHIKVSVAQAEQAARAVGKLPGWLQDLLALAREPEEDYTYLFEKFMAPMFPKDYTWQRPSRRFIGQGMYLPSMMKDGVGTLVVGLDTSASVSNHELSGFLGLINQFLERVKPEMTHVLYCDTSVYKHEKLKPGRPMELEGFQAQRGGTRFAPVFRHAIEHDLKPKAYVYLTDMECDDFGPDPGVPVLWMQVGSSAYAARPPFGQVIRIKS